MRNHRKSVARSLRQQMVDDILRHLKPRDETVRGNLAALLEHSQGNEAFWHAVYVVRQVLLYCPKDRTMQLYPELSTLFGSSVMRVAVRDRRLRYRHYYLVEGCLPGQAVCVLQEVGKAARTGNHPRAMKMRRRAIDRFGHDAVEAAHRLLAARRRRLLPETHGYVQA